MFFFIKSKNFQMLQINIYPVMKYYSKFIIHSIIYNIIYTVGLLYGLVFCFIIT
jgi:hypothetical protein